MAVTTALDIIKRALAKARVLGTGDILDDEDAQLSLDTLNLMLESWSIDRLFVYVEELQSYSIAGGVPQYTIGPGGDFNVTRPNELTSCYAVVNGVSYPVEILRNGQQYDTIQLKQLGQPWPQAIWYEKTYPLGTLHVWPMGNCSLNLRFTTALQQFANLTTQITLPPGYKEAIVNALAVKLAEDFNTDIPATVVQSASNAIARLKRLNSQPQSRGLEVSAVSRRYGYGGYNILSDNY